MGGAGSRRPGKTRGEVQQVPDAEFGSYYGRPVVKETVWGPDIPGYLFLGGLAGASSGLAAFAHPGNRELALAAKAAAAGAISLSMAALVHDLGRPARFMNMLRVLKVTSPMSVGSWISPGIRPWRLRAAACATRRMPMTGIAATIGAAALGPAVASYTAVLLSDTATPAWHGATRSCRTCSSGRPRPRQAASACWPSARAGEASGPARSRGRYGRANREAPARAPSRR